MTHTPRTPTATSPAAPRGRLARWLDALALWTVSIGDRNPYLRRDRVWDDSARG